MMKPKWKLPDSCGKMLKPDDFDGKMDQPDAKDLDQAMLGNATEQLKEKVLKALADPDSALASQFADSKDQCIRVINGMYSKKDENG